MKTIFQVVTANVNDEVTSFGEFFTTKENATEAIIKRAEEIGKCNNIEVKFWNLHPWRDCKVPNGIGSEMWTTYQVVRVIENKKTKTTSRHGIITHKVNE